MCGIAGIFDPHRNICGAVLKNEVAAMAEALGHRGPDDRGVWSDAQARVALGHRRLSILDLSPEGHQPMQSACGRHVITFNGEIYNYMQIRQELEEQKANPVWRGHSDTEVLLAAIEAWGLVSALNRCEGMFALALWDRRDRLLHLARDRLGEKPLYYGWQGDVFLFGSELKALRAHPAFSAEIDRRALTLFLRYNCVPAPYSIYRGIRKLPPGTYLPVSAGSTVIEPVSYWSAREAVTVAQSDIFRGSDDEARRELDRLIRQSLAGQMIADVPLGAFLSGGVDSSTVVALMQAQSSQPVKTFTIGFHESGYSEAGHAEAVARHLGTEHTEIYVTPDEAMSVIPKLPALYDEPFADSSQIPTYLLSALAQQHVTVSLSGDGGDELFGGYNRYIWATRIWRRFRFFPKSARAALARVVMGISPQRWTHAFRMLEPLLPKSLRYPNAGDKLHKLAEFCAAESPQEMYYSLISHWKAPTDIVTGGMEPLTVVTERERWPEVVDFEHWMMFLDLVSYLPDDILVKVDRAAMSVGLETRVPLLDRRIVEFAWRLPLSMKIRNGQGKWLLRRVLYKYVPRELIERPKMGFGIPLDIWLRGPLKEWAEALLGEARLRREGYFNPEPIRAKWLEHLSGRHNWSYHLWDVLMFQAWHEASNTTTYETTDAAVH